MTPDQALRIIEQERLDVLAEGATIEECEQTAAYVLASAYRKLMHASETHTPEAGRSSPAGALDEGTADNGQGAAPRLPGIDDKRSDTTDHRGDWIALVIRDICEIPYRFSPDDQPEMMLVTAEELREFIERHLPESATRESIIEECMELVRQEYLDDPSKEADDIAYDMAVGHCLDALKALLARSDSGGKNG